MVFPLPSPPRIACINDLRILAQKRVPKMFFEYAASGSYTQQTLKWNSEDFNTKIKLRQRVAVDVSKRTTSPSAALKKNKKLSKRMNDLLFSSSPSSMPLPLILAPIGLAGMQHVNGEIAAAKAARKHQIPITLSTMSITSIEDLRAGVDGDGDANRSSSSSSSSNHPPPLAEKFFFQLYMMKDREFMSRLIDRAKKQNVGALVVTLDLQILGQRHADIYNGLSAPPKLYNLQTLLQLARCPRWCVNQVLFAKRYNFGNIVEDTILASKVDDISSLSSWTSGQFDPAVNWETVKWLRNDQWKDKPLIVKGILDEDDAREACRVGVDAIIVSNHGGRQLDTCPSSISKLYSIRKAVEDECFNKLKLSTMPAIHFDGGITTGQQLFKALALGADTCWIGRSYVYGLGAMGEEGVSKAIEILQKELDVTMALTGSNSLDEVGIDKLVMTDEVKKEFGIW